MRLFKIYRRVLSSLGNDTRLAVMLSVANVIVAGLQFLDPVLFGRVIGMLSTSDQVPADTLWAQAVQLLGIWFGVGAAGDPRQHRGRAPLRADGPPQPARPS